MNDPTPRFTQDDVELTEVIWRADRADESRLQSSGAMVLARAVLDSDWLAQRDARVKAEAAAEALRSVAEDFDIEGRDVAAAELREWADVWQARS